MKLKSFFADSIEEALGLARREMGPDAMLVHSKRSSPDARHLGAYEVVCATEATADKECSPPPQPRPGTAAETLVNEVADLRRQIERLSCSLLRWGEFARVSTDPQVAAAFALLTEAELDADLALEIISRINPPFTVSALQEQLQRLVFVNPELGCPGSARKIVSVVGPPGAGKTSALVKLAIQQGVSLHKRVLFLSLDMYRIGAAEELQSYAAISGVGCQVLETGAALPQALSAEADLILIDTPGFSQNTMDENLAQALAAQPEIDTHLVLPASMRSADLKRAAEQYAIAKPQKLLFTRLDETQTFGPLLNHSVRMGLPLSFLANGQRIPEDLEPATVPLLLRLITKSEPAQAIGTVAA